MPHSLQTLNMQNSSTRQSSQSMRCQDNHPGSLSTSVAFTELLSTTITSLPPQPRVPEFYSFTHFFKAEAVMSQEHKGARVLGKAQSQETHNQIVRTVTWCMVKYPNPQHRFSALSLQYVNFGKQTDFIFKNFNFFFFL